MKRIAIVGAPGSGKTTFTRQLHAITGIPVVHLDYYYHQRRYDYPNNHADWVAKVQTLMEPAQWLMDGNYKSTIPMRCEAADTIIIFQLPRWLCLYRAIKRRITYHNQQRVDMPPEWKETAGWKFLAYIWTFNNQRLPLIQHELAKQQGKTVYIFKSTKDATNFLLNQKRLPKKP